MVEKGAGGLSLAERQQIASESARQAAVQQQIAGAENRALASMNPSAAGQAMQAQSQAAGDATATAAQGMASANVLSIQLREGKNREVRRLFEEFGYTVVRLHRAQYAGLTVRGLARGEWRPLDRREISALRRLVKLHDDV